jgi:hypothetical protein
MLASIIIAAISTVLFFYWFRYTCVLILSTKTSKDYTNEVAAANRLQFLEVQGVLRQAGAAELQRLQAALDRDYRVINFLLRHTADLEVGDASLEQHVLRLDFALMRAWYQVSSRVSDSAARKALAEMSSIVGHLANSFGERVAQGAQA